MPSDLRVPDSLLLAAVRAAPRRYLLPPLPADVEAARAAGPEAALAFAIESARVASQDGTLPPPGAQPLFTWALARVIEHALAPSGGDPAFQAVVLQARDPEVHEHVRLAAHAHGDRRAVRTLTDAIAHPGKMRRLPDGPLREALEHLHELASLGDWAALRAAVTRLRARIQAAGLRVALEAILLDPALRRLERSAALDASAGVRRYRALCAERGPLAGSREAAAQGRASARVGESAEAAAMRGFRATAERLQQAAGGEAQYRAVRTLRTPRGFPGEATKGKSKEEWDAAIVREAPEGAHLVLLAEVKAAPAAATSDFARLLRGLRRLALADAQQAYAFPGADGELRLAGASLQALRPRGHALPERVIYACQAAPEERPSLLAPASKAALLAERASLDFAQRIADGTPPDDEALVPVWEALATTTRLRAALHQYETAQAVRAAMLDPVDLLAELEATLPR